MILSTKVCEYILHALHIFQFSFYYDKRNSVKHNKDSIP